MTGNQGLLYGEGIEQKRVNILPGKILNYYYCGFNVVK